jgi:predicted O-methyltransferase YrrM
MNTFTKDWHGRHAKNWNRILGQYKNQPNIRYLEVGVYEGKSSCWVMDNILTHYTSTATGIDPWVNSDEQFRIATSNLRKYGNRYTIMRGYSTTVLPTLTNIEDIIYIDGDHHADAVYNDAILCWPKLKIGGILIFDDYNLRLRRHNRSGGEAGIPRPGIDKFLSLMSNCINIEKTRTQVFVKKIIKN